MGWGDFGDVGLLTSWAAPACKPLLKEKAKADPSASLTPITTGVIGAPGRSAQDDTLRTAGPRFARPDYLQSRRGHLFLLRRRDDGGGDWILSGLGDRFADVGERSGAGKVDAMAGAAGTEAVWSGAIRSGAGWSGDNAELGP